MLGGEVCAVGEMVGHMSLLRDLHGPFGGLNLGKVELEDCESLFTHLQTKKTIAEKYLARRFLSIQHALEGGALDNVFWVLGAGNPAGGLAEVRSEMAPLLRLLECGHFNPGSSRPSRGVA